MAFDIQAARSEGYSDEQIARYLAREIGFDIDSAMSEGYTLDAIIEYALAQPEIGGAVQDVGVLEGLGAAGKAVLYTAPAAIADTTFDTMDPMSRLSGTEGYQLQGEENFVTAADYVPESVKEVASGAIESWRARGQEAQQTFAEGTPDNYLGGLAYKAGGAFIQMLPAIAAGVITRNPNVAYAVMSVPAYSMAYEDAIANGASDEDAQAAGVRQAIYEVGAEKIFGVFDAAGGAQTLKDLALVMLREAGSEVLTEEASLIDEAVRGEDTGSTLEIAQRLFEAGVIGAMLGGGIAGSTMAANKVEELAGRDKAKAAEAAKLEEIKRQAELDKRRALDIEHTEKRNAAYRAALEQEEAALRAQEAGGFSYSGSVGSAPIAGASVGYTDVIKTPEEQARWTLEFRRKERQQQQEEWRTEAQQRALELSPDQQGVFLAEVEGMLQQQQEMSERLFDALARPNLWRPEQRNRVGALAETVGLNSGLRAVQEQLQGRKLSSEPVPTLFHVGKGPLGRPIMTSPLTRERATYNQREEDLINPNLDQIAAEVEADVGQEAAVEARASEKARFAGAETSQAIATFQRDSERREAERTEEAEDWANVARNPNNIPFLKNAKNSPWRVTAINPETGRVFVEYQSGSVRMSLTWLLDNPNNVEPHAVVDDNTADFSWRHEFGKGRKSKIGLDAVETGQWDAIIPRQFKQEVTYAASEALRNANPNWRRGVDDAKKKDKAEGEVEAEQATEAADAFPSIAYVGSVSTAQARKAAKQEAADALRAENKGSPWRINKESLLKAEEAGLANLDARKEETRKRLAESVEEGATLDELRGIKPHEQDAGAQIKTYISSKARARIAKGDSVYEDAWQILPDGTIRKLRIRPEATKDPKNKKLEGMDAYVARPVAIGPNPIAEGEGPVLHVFKTKPNEKALAKIGERTTNQMKPRTRIDRILKAEREEREAQETAGPQEQVIEKEWPKQGVAVSVEKEVSEATAATTERKQVVTPERAKARGRKAKRTAKEKSLQREEELSSKVKRLIRKHSKDWAVQQVLESPDAKAWLVHKLGGPSVVRTPLGPKKLQGMSQQVLVNALVRGPIWQSELHGKAAAKEAVQERREETAAQRKVIEKKEQAQLESMRGRLEARSETDELRKWVGQRALTADESADVMKGRGIEAKFERMLNDLLEPFFETNLKKYSYVQRALDRGMTVNQIKELFKRAGIKSEDWTDLSEDRGTVERTPKGERQKEAARRFIRSLVRGRKKDALGTHDKEMLRDMESPEIIAMTKLLGAWIEIANPDVSTIEELTTEDLRRAYRTTDAFINDVIWAVRNEKMQSQRKIPDMWEDVDLVVADLFSVPQAEARSLLVLAGVLPPAIEDTLIAQSERKTVEFDKLVEFAETQRKRAEQSRFAEEAPGWAKAKARDVRTRQGKVPLERRSDTIAGRTLPAEETKAPARERVALDQRLRDTIARIAKKTDEDIRTSAKERRDVLELAYDALGSKEGLSVEALQKIEELRAKLRGPREQRTEAIKQTQDELRAREERAALEALEAELAEIQQQALAKDAELKAAWEKIRPEVEGVMGGLDAQGRPVWPDELTPLQQEILLETGASSPITLTSLNKYEQIRPGVYAPAGTMAETKKVRLKLEQEARNQELQKKAEAELDAAMNARFTYKNPTESLLPDRLRRKKQRRMVETPKVSGDVKVTAASWEVTPLTKSAVAKTQKYLGKSVTAKVILRTAYELQSDPDFLAARREVMSDAAWERANAEVPPLAPADLLQATQTIEVGGGRFSALLQSIWVGSRAQEALNNFWETHPRIAAFDRAVRRMAPSRTAGLTAPTIGKPEAQFIVRGHELLLGEQNTQINLMSRSWAIARRYINEAGFERTNADHNRALDAYLEGTDNVTSLERTYGFRIPDEALPHLRDVRERILKLAKLGVNTGAWRKEETRGAIIGGRFYLHHFADKEIAQDAGKKGIEHLPLAADEVIALAKHSWHLPVTAAEVGSMSRSQLISMINNSQHSIFRDKLSVSSSDTATTAKNVLVGLDQNDVGKWQFGTPGALKTISKAELKRLIKEAPKAQQKQVKEQQTQALREFVMANLPTDQTITTAINKMLQAAAPTAEMKLQGGYGSRVSITRERELFLSQREMVRNAHNEIMLGLNKDEREAFEQDWEANRKDYLDLTVDGFLQEIENKYPDYADGIESARKTQKFNTLLRHALGEVVDTESVMHATIEGLAATVLTSRYVGGLLDVGRGDFMSVRGEPLADGSTVPPDWVPLAPENSALGRTTLLSGVVAGEPSFVAANEILVPPEMAEFMKILFDIDAGVQRGVVKRWSYRLSGITKYGLVLINPLAHIRNGISTGFIFLSNHAVGLGLIRAHKYGGMHLAAVERQALGGKSESLSHEGKSVELQTLEELVTSLHVTYDGARMGALLDVRKEGAGAGGTLTFFQTRGKSLPRMAQYWTEEQFRMEDEAVKIPAFLMNAAERLILMGHSDDLIDQYLSKAPMTDADLKVVMEAFEFSANLVADTYPTFSRAAHVIKLLSRSPILGAFPTFTYEMMRTTVWSYKNDIQLMRGRMYDGKKVAPGQAMKARALGTARFMAKTALWNATVVAQQMVTDLLLKGWDDEEDDGWLDTFVDFMAGRVGVSRLQELSQGGMTYYHRNTTAAITDMNPESYTIRQLGYAMPTGGIEDSVMRNVSTAIRLYANGSKPAFNAALDAVLSTTADIWLKEEVLLGHILKRWNMKRPLDTEGGELIFTPKDARIGRIQGDLLDRAVRELVPGNSIFDPFLGGIAGGIGESLPWNVVASQSVDFVKWMDKLITGGEIPEDEVRRAETLISGMAHAAGWKTTEVRLPDWATQWDRDAAYFSAYTSAMHRDLIVKDDDTYEEFAARFAVMNEERKHAFKVLHNSIAFAVGPWKQDPAKILGALRDVGRVNSVGGVPMSAFVRGDYIPPTPNEFWESIHKSFSETTGTNRLKTVARSDEELYKFYKWYVRAYEEEGYEQIDY